MCRFQPKGVFFLSYQNTKISRPYNCTLLLKTGDNSPLSFCCINYVQTHYLLNTYQHSSLPAICNRYASPGKNLDFSTSFEDCHLGLSEERYFPFFRAHIPQVFVNLLNVFAWYRTTSFTRYSKKAIILLRAWFKTV